MEDEEKDPIDEAVRLLVDMAIDSMIMKSGAEDTDLERLRLSRRFPSQELIDHVEDSQGLVLEVLEEIGVKWLNGASGFGLICPHPDDDDGEAELTG